MIATPRNARHRDLGTDRDRQLYIAAKELLSTSSYSALRQLNCRVAEGVVEVSGVVASFYLKQLVQAAMQRLQPPDRVRNLVEVSGESPVAVATSCAPLRTR